MQAFSVCLGFATGLLELAHALNTCPGSISVEGYGTISPTNAIWDTPGKRTTDVKVSSELSMIMPDLGGRTYFTDACSNGTYSPSSYSPFKLLNMTLSWTTKLSGAGCGCNAAFYLTSMHQSTNVSGCNDYYCDASAVCNVRCSEIDLQEANMHSYHAALHTGQHGDGLVSGYGGGNDEEGEADGPRNFTKAEYGPKGTCIDTAKPFRAAVSFPTDAKGKLAFMVTTLSQVGKPCNLTFTAGREGYWHEGRDGMEELTTALLQGMTPIVSYWKSENLGWLDAVGKDGNGPCEEDVPEDCADSVQFYDLRVEPMHKGSVMEAVEQAVAKDARMAEEAAIRAAPDGKQAAGPGAEEEEDEEEAAGVVENAKDAAEKVAEGAKDAAEKVAETAKEGADKVAEGAKDAAEKIKEAISPARHAAATPLSAFFLAACLSLGLSV